MHLVCEPKCHPYRPLPAADRALRRLFLALLDVTLSPGQLLYIPAGFPHVTDTIVDAEGEPSVHLTLGVDTHVWDLNYASMRHSALKRQKLSTLIDG